MKTSALIACWSALLFLPAAAKTPLGGNAPPPPVQDPVDNFYLQGNYAQAMGNYSYAIDCWTGVLRIHADDATAFYNRAVAYDSEKKTDKALADIGESIRLAPKDPQACEFRAKIFSASAGTPGDASWLKAVADYNTALQLRLEGVADPKAWIVKQTSTGSLQPIQAIVYWDAAIKLDPKDAAAWMARGDVYGSHGWLDRAAADYAGAIRINPDDKEAHIHRATMDTGESDNNPPRDLAEAAADLTEAIRIAPDKNTYIFRGTVYAKLHRDDKAAADFIEGARLGAEREGYTELADLYVRSKQWSKVYDAYTELIRIAPEDAAWHYHRAAAAYEMKDWDKAIPDLDLAVIFYSKGHDSMDNSALQLRAGAYYHKRDWEKSLADFNRLAAEPTDWQGRMGAAWIYATCPDEKSRDGAKAIQLAGELCDKNRWLYHGDIDILAAAYAEAGKWDDAIATEQKAIDLAKTPRYNPDPAVLAELNAHLVLYQQKKPCREEKEPLLYQRR